jgi:hypothetical protein
VSKHTLRKTALAATLGGVMALGAASPAAAGPKLITGNPGKGATVLHCKALGAPGARGVMVVTPSGRVNNNCRGLPATLQRTPALQAALAQLPAAVRQALEQALPPVPTP